MPYIWTETKNLAPIKGFTHEGIQYPANWASKVSEAERTAIGISFVENDRPKVSDKFYSVSGELGNWTTTPRDLNHLKVRAIADCKKRAASRLKATDWYVIRKLEAGTEIPAEISEVRTATREYSNTLEAEISATDFEGLQSLKQDWPLTDAERAELETGI